MESIKQPDTINIYLLLKQDGMNFTPASVTATPSLGMGFFWRKEDAEMHRTFEYTKLVTGQNSLFHIFELTVPNPTVRE